jgi:hypothetical protein
VHVSRHVTCHKEPPHPHHNHDRGMYYLHTHTHTQTPTQQPAQPISTAFQLNQSARPTQLGVHARCVQQTIRPGTHPLHKRKRACGSERCSRPLSRSQTTTPHPTTDTPQGAGNEAGWLVPKPQTHV